MYVVSGGTTCIAEISGSADAVTASNEVTTRCGHNANQQPFCSSFLTNWQRNGSSQCRLASLGPDSRGDGGGRRSMTYDGAAAATPSGCSSPRSGTPALFSAR